MVLFRPENRYVWKSQSFSAPKNRPSRLPNGFSERKSVRPEIPMVFHSGKVSCTEIPVIFRSGKGSVWQTCHFSGWKMVLYENPNHFPDRKTVCRRGHGVFQSEKPSGFLAAPFSRAFWGHVFPELSPERLE